MSAEAVKILVVISTNDAGESTRALEIADALIHHRPENTHIPDIRFLTHGGKFDDRFRSRGYLLEECLPRFHGMNYQEDLQTEMPNFVGNEEICRDVIKGELEKIKSVKPDFIIHGMWPFVGIARKIANIPAVAFIPLPCDQSVAHLVVADFPEHFLISKFLPLSVKQFLIRNLGRYVIPKLVVYAQPRITRSMVKYQSEIGWPVDIPQPRNLFDMIRPDLLIVNELPEYFPFSPPPHIKFTGPLFAREKGAAVEIDPKIAELFSEKWEVGSDKNGPRIFMTMGSSGIKDIFLSVVQGLTLLPNNYRIVILSPAACCPIAETTSITSSHANIYVTDSFVPAVEINRMSDLLLSHGGQGTIQTSLSVGVPIVGIAMQIEQQINIDNAANWGAAIRITQINARKPLLVQQAVLNVIESYAKFKSAAEAAAERYSHVDGPKNAADEIWKWWLGRAV